jgi:glycosyltransferase involved in cell wall biosynthesis
MNNFPDLTLVIPAKENKKNIEYILKQLKSYNLKKIIILDSKKFFYKNTKDTLYFIQKKRGYGSAIIEGILKVKTKFFCIYNADGSFSPEELNKMYNNLKKNDFVFGSRYKKGGYSEDDTLITKLGNFFFISDSN